MKNGAENIDVDLAELAKTAMLERGFFADFPPEVQAEVAAINAPANPPPIPSFKDMREKLWISIDNDDSKDLDQLTYAEIAPDGKEMIYIAVADVDALVKKGSASDAYAYNNTTSVYTPEKIFPMLDPKLSTNLTSLNPDVDRCAVVVEIFVDKSGEFIPQNIHLAWVHNYAKMAYSFVGDFIENGKSLPDTFMQMKGIKEQIILQDMLAQRIQAFRDQEGALTFASSELKPIIVNSKVVDVKTAEHNRAHKLIENFMISANVAVTNFLIDKGLPTLRRIVRTPDRWDRIVQLVKEYGTDLPPEPDSKALRLFLLKQSQENADNFPELSLALIKLIGKGEYYAGFPNEESPGHFDLALIIYAHTTAPNRRFPDVVMQRLLKSHFFGEELPYTKDELMDIAAQCTQKENDSNKVERKMMKSAAALYLSSMIGKEFPAIVTGASERGTWVRLSNPPIEGKLVRGTKGLDVGDKLRVKLVHTDVFFGYIDFIRA
ncbi:MAG: RNB domain-containing ribonuclease [Parachlamydiales bacterium]|jgi:exoribonuclease-2